MSLLKRSQPIMQIGGSHFLRIHPLTQKNAPLGGNKVTIFITKPSCMDNLNAYLTFVHVRALSKTRYCKTQRQVPFKTPPLFFSLFLPSVSCLQRLAVSALPLASHPWRLAFGVLPSASCPQRLTLGVLPSASRPWRLTLSVSPLASCPQRLILGVSSVS